MTWLRAAVGETSCNDEIGIERVRASCNTREPDGCIDGMRN